MTLISKLKALLGLETRHREERTATAVPVEREPAAETERAVKEPEPTRGAAEESPEAEPSTAVEPTEEPPGPEAEPAAESEAKPEAKPEAEPEPERDDTAAADAPVQSISGIGPAYADRLAEAGVETVGDLAAADAAGLAEATGLGEGRVADWIERARAE